MEIPTFKTKRLILKEIDLKDAPSYQRNFVDYEVIRNLSAVVPWPYPENGIIDFIITEILPNQGKDRWMWGIFLKENPMELIGVVDLWRKGRPENRGFWLGCRFWGKGYMTEAVAPVMDFAFSQLGFDKLVFSNASGNIGSRRIKEKTGAKFLRTEPAKFVDPKFTEREVWELTKVAWNAFRSGNQNDFSILFSLEEKVLDAVTRGDRQEVDLLLAPEFFEFGCSGKVWTRESVLESLNGEKSPRPITSDFKGHRLSENIIQITFNTQTSEATGDNSKVLRSSIWKRDSGQWRMIFHQGTKTLGTA